MFEMRSAPSSNLRRLLGVFEIWAITRSLFDDLEHEGINKVVPESCLERYVGHSATATKSRGKPGNREKAVRLIHGRRTVTLSGRATLVGCGSGAASRSASRPRKVSFFGQVQH